jgi:hypothetical protein
MRKGGLFSNEVLDIFLHVYVSLFAANRSTPPGMNDYHSDSNSRPMRFEIEPRMTLTPFPPAMLDELALRLLDVAAAVRKMANSAREISRNDFQLHGNKAQEWLNNLELWASDGIVRMEQQALRERGARRGRALAESSLRTTSEGRARRGKKTS